MHIQHTTLLLTFCSVLKTAEVAARGVRAVAFFNTSNKQPSSIKPIESALYYTFSVFGGLYMDSFMFLLKWICSKFNLCKLKFTFQLQLNRHKQ